MVRRIEGRSGGVGAALMALAVLVAVAGALAAGSGARAAEETPEGVRPPIDINAASTAELARLPGVGEVTAKRIVAFREEHGPFRRVEDLMKVKGIGEKSFQKLRTSITVGKSRS